MKNYYTVTAYKRIDGDAEYDIKTFKILAEEHRQHVWNKDILCGVSVSGNARLNKLQAEGYKFTVDSTKYNPVLVGWEL